MVGSVLVGSKVNTGMSRIATENLQEQGTCVTGRASGARDCSDASVWWLNLEADRTELLEVAANRRGYLLATTTPLHVRCAASDAATRLKEGEGLGIEGAGTRWWRSDRAPSSGPTRLIPPDGHNGIHARSLTTESPAPGFRR